MLLLVLSELKWLFAINAGTQYENKTQIDWEREFPSKGHQICLQDSKGSILFQSHIVVEKNYWQLKEKNSYVETIWFIRALNNSV